MTNTWTPLTQREISQEFQAVMRRYAESGKSANPSIDLVDEVWANDEYEVVVRYMEPSRGRGGALHLSVKRYDREPLRDWRHFQSIKNEVAGREREGIELFPAESRLVDQANQYHMWVMEAGVQLPLGFPERYVLTEEQAREEMKDVLGPGPNKGRQRSWQPGLSTGPDYHKPS